METYIPNLRANGNQKKVDNLKKMLSKNMGERSLTCPTSLARGARDLRHQNLIWMLEPAEEEALSRTTRAVSSIMRYL